MTFRAVLRLLLILIVVAGLASPVSAQEHGAAATPAKEEPHGQGLLQTVAKLLNFAILAGVLVYYLRAPIAGYLQTRSGQIRQDLVTAADVRRSATAQLDEIGRKLASLPAELDALRARGAEDMAAEEARIARTAHAERERLLNQTRREIDMRLRVARRELTEHVAKLAVAVAEQRISRTITQDDQLRLVDRYTDQLAERGSPLSGLPEAGPGAGAAGHEEGSR